MTLLAPSALWFLGLISIPIIIHLLSRFRLKKVEFSSIRYIKQLKTNSIRKLEVQQIILLLLRIFIILSLVLMISQPVTRGFMPGWFSAEQESQLIIIIDNSASMNAVKDDETLLQKSKVAAIQLLKNFNNKTQLNIIQTCPQMVLYDGIITKPGIPEIIQSISPTASHDNLWHQLNLVLKNNQEGPSIRECIIFSDMLHSPDSQFIKGISDLEKWKFYFVLPGQIKDNLSIQDVSPINRIKTINQLIKLNTHVINSGISPRSNAPLELLFNKNRVGQVVSKFEPGSHKEFIFQAYPGDMGIINGEIILHDDDYHLDNSWFISLPIMEKVRCGIIASNNEEISILRMMLNAIDPRNEFLYIDTRIQPDLNRLFLDDLDVAIIHNPNSISDGAISDIEQFLKDGNGLIWFQGDNNGVLHSDLFNNLGFPEIEKIVDAGQGFFSTQIAESDTDILIDLEVRDINREMPEVFKYIKTNLSKSHKPHWVLNNQDPLLIEFSKFSGDIFYFTTLMDLRWNDLAMRGMVIPMLYQLLVLTGTDEINTSAVIIDGTKWIPIDEKYLRNKWEIKSPSGNIEMVVPDYDNEGIRIMSTSELGIYSVYSNDELFTSFPTRLHPKEYIQDAKDQSDIDNFINSEQVRWLKIENNFEELFSEIRHGKTLWKLFLIIAIILFIIETILSRPQPLKMKSNN